MFDVFYLTTLILKSQIIHQNPQETVDLFGLFWYYSVYAIGSRMSHGCAMFCRRSYTLTYMRTPGTKVP